MVDEVHAVLREGIKRRQFEVEYDTPSGEKRFLAITISQVPSVDGSLLGVACLINDLSELERSASSVSCTARCRRKWRCNCAFP